MKNKKIVQFIAFVMVMTLFSCKNSQIFNDIGKVEKKDIPSKFADSLPVDSTNMADWNWKKLFTDPNLVALIDTALIRNQELNIILQEIDVAKNEVRLAKGEILPTAGVRLGVGMDKYGEYTANGAVESQLEVEHGKHFPKPMGDFNIGAYFSWEVDLWKKLRNSKKAATSRFLSSVEGKNFMVTNLVSEIADSYYELVALDKKLEVIDTNIAIQSEALEVVKKQKDAARVTQLAVNRFEAQLLNTTNLKFEIQQEIVEAENRINFLIGSFPKSIQRSSEDFKSVDLVVGPTGVPSQLLSNRADIRRAEQELMASKLDVKVARASFLPSFGIKAGAGFNAFSPRVWFNPESILLNLVGDLVAPLINRNALKAKYYSANARQNQAVFDYERSILNAYIEVVNQLSKLEKYDSSYNTKQKEVELLNQSVNISNSLFSSARADYMEVLLTQRETIDATMDLIEIKLIQLNAKIDLYRSLGGGWK